MLAARQYMSPEEDHCVAVPMNSKDAQNTVFDFIHNHNWVHWEHVGLWNGDRHILALQLLNVMFCSPMSFFLRRGNAQSSSDVRDKITMRYIARTRGLCICCPRTSIAFEDGDTLGRCHRSMCTS